MLMEEIQKKCTWIKYKEAFENENDKMNPVQLEAKPRAERELETEQRTFLPLSSH
jgi:hypothetical protein